MKKSIVILGFLEVSDQVASYIKGGSLIAAIICVIAAVIALQWAGLAVLVPIACLIQYAHIRAQQAKKDGFNNAKKFYED